MTLIAPLLAAALLCSVAATTRYMALLTLVPVFAVAVAMTPSTWQRRLTDLGLFGVIGSLIFVGLQLKLTQDIALSENYQHRTSAIIEMNAGAMSSPEFLSGVSKVYLNKSDELTMPEAVALEWYIGTNLMVLENNHLQFEAGFLTPEHWQRNLEELDCILTVPLFLLVSSHESVQSQEVPEVSCRWP